MAAAVIHKQPDAIQDLEVILRRHKPDFISLLKNPVSFINMINVLSFQNRHLKGNRYSTSVKITIVRIDRVHSILSLVEITLNFNVACLSKAYLLLVCGVNLILDSVMFNIKLTTSF